MVTLKVIIIINIERATETTLIILQRVSGKYNNNENGRDTDSESGKYNNNESDRDTDSDSDNDRDCHRDMTVTKIGKTPSPLSFFSFLLFCYASVQNPEIADNCRT